MWPRVLKTRQLGISLRCWWSTVCVEPTLIKRVLSLVDDGKSFANFQTIAWSYPPNLLGLTVLQTRQCGEIISIRIASCLNIFWNRTVICRVSLSGDASVSETMIGGGNAGNGLNWIQEAELLFTQYLLMCQIENVVHESNIPYVGCWVGEQSHFHMISRR